MNTIQLTNKFNRFKFTHSRFESLKNAKTISKNIQFSNMFGIFLFFNCDIEEFGLDLKGDSPKIPDFWFY